jgi:hypothetical protein
MPAHARAHTLEITNCRAGALIWCQCVSDKPFDNEGTALAVSLRFLAGLCEAELAGQPIDHRGQHQPFFRLMFL